MPDPNLVPVQDLNRIARTDFPWLDTLSLELLARYISELLTWNKKINLIGKQDWSSAYQFLIKDSLHLPALLTQLDLPKHPLTLDLGTGAGLPGIPLRIAWPTGEYLLVEPRKKRALFLHHAVRTLSLQRTYVRTCRTEDLHEPPADLILSRAMCSWLDLLPLVRPLLSTQGFVVIFSNQYWDPGQACPAGWRLQQERAYPIKPDLDRYFWVFSPMT